ncbi:hypothetical protein EVAR_69223_1 [Eumeta japonica]|uniref:Uncharacterized protein n=1 Tax=Eumeta variegata TaxID=151549 RepID=A0A4C1ZS25_EUMVA|nr:hypothetical protein EVAR_69223_1 [Eumeta japonica]
MLRVTAKPGRTSAPPHGAHKHDSPHRMLPISSPLRNSPAERSRSVDKLSSCSTVGRHCLEVVGAALAALPDAEYESIEESRDGAAEARAHPVHLRGEDVASVQ